MDFLPSQRGLHGGEKPIFSIDHLMVVALIALVVGGCAWTLLN